MAEQTYTTETRIAGDGSSYTVRVPTPTSPSTADVPYGDTSTPALPRSSPTPASTDTSSTPSMSGLPNVGDSIPGTNLKYEQSDIDNLKNNQTLPRVTPPSGTPTPTPTPTLTPTVPPVQNPPTPAPTPAPTEEQNYATLLQRAQKNISDVTHSFNTQIKSADAASAARVNAGGLAGSTSGGQIYTEAQQPIIDARNAAIDQIYQKVQDNALNLTQLTDTEAATAFQQKEQIKADAQDSVKTMAANHLDWQAYKTTNPDNYNALVQSLGGDPNYADALFASSIPKGNVVQSWVSGSTYNQLTTDPVTGKPSIQTYDLGVNIPQNWTADKISTNAVIYHGPNWDPKDPSTFQMFAVDPLTGIPTSQVGGDTNPTMPTQVPSDISTLSDAISQVESGGSYTAQNPSGALGKYQIMPKDWFPMIGLDPTSADDKAKFLADPALQDQTFSQIIGSLSKQYNGNLGKTIAAYFGGAPGAQAYGTPQGDTLTDGNMSVNDYVNKVLGNAGLSSTVGGSGTGMSDVIKGALDIYKKTGSIPSFGYGAAGAALKKQFYSAIAQDSGIVGEATGNKAAVAGMTTALRTQENQYAANQTSIGTLDGQLKLVQKYSDKVDRTDSPLVNKYDLWLKGKVKGDADTAALNNIVKTASNEFAKILSGSSASIAGVTVSSATDAEDMLNASLSKGQLTEVLGLMQQESQLRLSNQKLTIDNLNHDISNIGTDTSGGGTNNAKGSLDDKTYVENTLKSHGLKYDDVISQYTPNLQSGEKLALDNTTGAIIAVTSSDDPSKYTPL